MIVRACFVALTMLGSPLVAQEMPPAPPTAALPPAAVPAATVRVTLTTALGPIVIALEKDRAPLTSAYFLKHVDQKRLDGTTFYRAYKVAPDGSIGLVQGGVLDPKRQLPPIAHEPTSKTGLTHTEGAISLARLAPGTATANFFIVVGDLTGLDAQPPGKGDPDGYAVFGHVVEGMDVVKKILDAPIDPAKGDGGLKGQMIAAPIRIVSARRD